MKLSIQCDWCKKKFYREASKLNGKKHHFCSRQCLADFSNKSKNPNGYYNLKDYTNMAEHLSKLNLELNPHRMTPQTREKLRNHRLNTGQGKSYSKIYGRHEHRAIAKQILGRKLQGSEVVHHIDGNKRNNEIDNLIILPSQSEHAKLHVRERRFWNGGDAK